MEKRRNEMRYVTKEKRKKATVRNIFKRWRRGRIIFEKAAKLAEKYETKINEKD